MRDSLHEFVADGHVTSVRSRRGPEASWGVEFLDCVLTDGMFVTKDALVCLYIYTYVCIYTYTCICIICIYMYVCMYVCMYVYIHMYVYIYMYDSVLTDGMFVTKDVLV